MTATTPLQAFSSGYRGSVDFRDAAVRQYLHGGWDVEPGNVTWSVHQRAELEIPVPGDTGALHLRAQVAPFLAPPGLPEQQLYVLVNGVAAAEFRLTQPGRQNIEWTATSAALARNPGLLRLSFLLPNAASPQSLDAGSDLRLLGVAVTELLIESESLQQD